MGLLCTLERIVYLVSGPLKLEYCMYACYFYLVNSAVPYFCTLVDLLSLCTIRYWQWGIEVSNYYCWIKYFPFISVCFASCIWYTAMRFVYIYYNYKFLCIDTLIIMKCAFLSLVTFFTLKVYFNWY